MKSIEDWRALIGRFRMIQIIFWQSWKGIFGRNWRKCYFRKMFFGSKNQDVGDLSTVIGIFYFSTILPFWGGKNFIFFKKDLFKQIFTQKNILETFFLKGRFPSLENKEIEMLRGDISDDEVRKTIFHMGVLQGFGWRWFPGFIYQSQ